jgi:hypothetical protein
VLKLKPSLQYSQGRSAPWSGSKLLNGFAEQSNGDQREMFAVMLIPGLTALSTLPTAPVRGVHQMNDVLYAVSGERLYSVTAGGVATDLGAIPGSGRVAMADNGTQLGIVSGSTGYVLSGGSITTPANLPSVSDVAYIDGYMLWVVASSKQFVISGLNDALTYDPADIASVEGTPDDIVGVIVDHREVLFFKKHSIEVWYNSGAAAFPFERQGNAFIERGCLGRDTIVKIDNAVMFVGDDEIVYRLDGYAPVRMSTHTIEYKIAAATDYWAYTYTQEGHKFYVLMTDAGTFPYDLATTLWHERGSLGLDNWRAGYAVPVYGQTIFASHTTGKLYTASLDSYAEDGDPITMEITLPTIESGTRDRVTLYAFELLCETGVGNGSAPSPTVSLSYSDDGGRTFTAGVSRNLGADGQYRTRAIWRKLGQFRQRQIKLTITSSVRRFVLGYFADIR